MPAVTNGHQRSTERNHPRGDNASTRSERRYASGRHDYLIRLRRIEGQVRGLQHMVEADRCCPEIVTQIASVTRALQEVAVGLLHDHVGNCVMAAADSQAEGRVRLEELSATIRQVVRL